MRARDVMTRPVITVHPDSPAQEAHDPVVIILARTVGRVSTVRLVDASSEDGGLDATPVAAGSEGGR